MAYNVANKKLGVRQTNKIANFKTMRNIAYYASGVSIFMVARVVAGKQEFIKLGCMTFI